MNLTILINEKLGWIFVIGQIIIIYGLFILVQKKIEEKRGKKP